MTAWWAGLAGTEATVACNGNDHRLRWEKGNLQALDHDDPESERALAAIGGETFACMDLLKAWERHSDDLRVLTLGSRGQIDQLRTDPDEHPKGRAGRGRMRSRGGSTSAYSYIAHSQSPTRISKADRDQADLTELLTLANELPNRLQATVTATWERRLRTGHRQLDRSRPQLEAALHGRVVAELAAWSGPSGLDATTTMSASDRPRSLRRQNGHIHAELPFSWLVEVWARGLTTVFGRFCVAAESSTGKRWTLTTVGPDLGAPETMVISLPASTR